MNVTRNKVTTVFSVLLATTVLAGSAVADSLFFDDFEDRVKDQPLIGDGVGPVGGGWTWYNQAYSDTECTVYSSGWGPYSDGDGSDYLQENRNYWTASADEGYGDSYFRAGLEVPAWATDAGEKVVLSNMLRVYGDPNYAPEGAVNCKRILIFQEVLNLDIAGGFTFSFDTAMDRYNAPANGEITSAFVKVLDPSNNYDEVIFEHVETMPPVSSTPENASMASQAIDFTITEEMAGMLLQFGFFVDIVESQGQGWDTAAALYDNVMLAATDIGPAHSGSWFNDTQSGHGFSIEFGEINGDPLAIAYWYTYDSVGNPIFMVGTGVPDGQEVVITFDSPTGMNYGEFNPVPFPRDVGGVAVFTFSDRDNGTFSYTPSPFSETNWGHTTPIENLPITKIFGIPADRNFSSTE